MAEPKATVAEAMAAGVAHQQAGRLKLNEPADLVVFACKGPGHLPYHLGMNHVRWVIKGGDVVVHRDGDSHVCE